MDKYLSHLFLRGLFISALLTTFPGAACSNEVSIEALEGVYKERFENGLIDGSKYTSENIFEFVRIDDDAGYFKLHLEFYNGHECNVAGLARFSPNNGYAFQDPEKADACPLAITVKDKDIIFTDDSGNCHKFCGARGGFAGASFPLSGKKPIRYMPLILKSKEYVEALESYGKKTEK